MMKFRRLETDELTALEPEFIRFLAANQVTASDWEKLKAEDVEKAHGLIDLFSDIVFEKILSGVDYLEQRDPKTIRIFKFEEEKVVMNGLTVKGSDVIDLTKDQDAAVLKQLFEMSAGKLNIFSGEKKYRKPKLEEIFDLMEKGCLILKDPTIFDTIEKLKQ
ncbi:DUF6495 family protein [Membranihabitans marinus]|uniref:DUF6495 family protein n=1 Tax=Membranihabitans marinus TaxID=1227546 RepID=UPI001F15B9C8|nr:DUF6495 family protein [Membranihabitans marinus]